LNHYLSINADEKKSDSLSLLINGEWKYLKCQSLKSYSKVWKKMLPASLKMVRCYPSQKKIQGDIRFSPVIFSQDRNKAFVIYVRTVNNIPQATSFFFFEKKDGVWIHRAHYIQFFD